MNLKRSDIIDSVICSGLKPPKEITIMITNRCNLSCHHCLPESHLHETKPMIPAREIKRLIREFIHIGIQEVCLTGGEPLLHPDWFEILSYTCKQPGLNSVRLQTNATLLTEADVDALCSLNYKGLVVQVSLEGVSAETNDTVRGPASFEKILRGLRLLTNAGLGQQVVVAFTEMAHNFPEIPNLMKLLDELGVGCFVTGALVMGGRAMSSDQLLPPTPSQYSKLLNLYHSDLQFRLLYKKMGNIAALEWYEGKSNFDETQCGCIEKPYINSDGEMYPCIMLPIKKYSIPNVFSRSLEDVILDGVPLWAELPDLNYKRSTELEKCKLCPGKKHCAGGCMGRAYTLAGDFMTVEDRCELRKIIYSWSPLYSHLCGRSN